MLDDEHPRYAHDLMALGSIRTVAGRYAEAEPPLREALAIIEAAAADVEPRVLADAHLALARALVLGGRQEEGRPHAEEGLRLAAALTARSGRKRLALELLAERTKLRTALPTRPRTGSAWLRSPELVPASPA